MVNFPLLSNDSCIYFFFFSSPNCVDLLACVIIKDSYVSFSLVSFS